MPSRTRPTATRLLVAGLLGAFVLASPPAGAVPTAAPGQRAGVSCVTGYELSQRAVLRDTDGRRIGRVALRRRDGETPGFCLRVRIAERHRSRGNVVFKQLAVREGEGSAAVAVRQPTSHQTPLALPAADLDASVATALVEVTVEGRLVRVRLRSAG
ncbi:MAG: hypothetical protein ACI379_11760 [Nocardioides sp.]|uniref:hypothetical protein n=1 Tax=Nocardioides sp. TaxID=35761 RepID=UPI003F0E55F3